MAGGYKKIHKHPKHNEKGFHKHPENINKDGAPRKPISALLREFGEMQKIEYNVEFTDTQGNKKTKSGKIENKNKDGTINELLALVLMQKGLSGNVRAWEMIVDRQEGKPSQKVDANINHDINDITPLSFVKSIENDKD